ncbi:unnamed protein product [Cercopithifilaria johnstoni]|uniref:Uncharacterized protein n=1 Tax=Cercopithifilaria johnstoni TaxID=2874296 RepID=A0A8J2LWB6_9BILA|nr:unnamed protein product [Cercopithifilaria johnstoni]
MHSISWLQPEECDNSKKFQHLSSKRSKFQNKTAKNLLKNDIESGNKSKSNVMEAELALDERTTRVEMLNDFGLERLLTTTTYNDNRYLLELLSGTMPPIGNSRMNNRPNKHIGCEKLERHVLHDY